MDATEVTMIVGAIGSVLAFLGTIANMVNTNYKDKQARKAVTEKEDRDRKWAKEDSAELARQTAATLLLTSRSIAIQHQETKVALGDIAAASEVRLKTIVQGQHDLAGKIEENTELTKSATVAAEVAYKEANNVNEKLRDLGVKLVAGTEPKEVIVVNAAPIPVTNTP